MESWKQALPPGQKSLQIRPRRNYGPDAGRFRNLPQRRKKPAPKVRQIQRTSTAKISQQKRNSSPKAAKDEGDAADVDPPAPSSGPPDFSGHETQLTIVIDAHRPEEPFRQPRATKSSITRCRLREAKNRFEDWHDRQSHKAPLALP